MRRGFALYKGAGKGKLLAIDLSADDLWFSAWCGENLDMNLMPVKMSRQHIEQLTALGYRVRAIRFERAITKDAAK